MIFYKLLRKYKTFCSHSILQKKTDDNLGKAYEKYIRFLVGLHEKNHKKRGQKCRGTRINKGYFDKIPIRTDGIRHFRKRKRKYLTGVPLNMGRRKGRNTTSCARSTSLEKSQKNFKKGLKSQKIIPI